MIAATEGKEMAREFLKFINNMGCDEEGFAFSLANDHRTLQQSAMRVFMLFVKEMAATEHWDLRNEASVMLARKIMALDDTHLPFI